MKRMDGFTLIELVIVIALISILSVPATHILTQVLKSYFTAQTITDNQNQVGVAVHAVMRELKNGNSLSNISATGLSFVNQNGQSIVIALSGTTLTRSVDSGMSQKLCKNVSSLTFDYFDQAYASTSIAASVLFVTMTLTVNNAGLPYSLMSGTVLRTLLP